MLKQRLIFLLFNLLILEQALANGLQEKLQQARLISSSAQLCAHIPDEAKVDCYPEITSNEQGCLDRKCCWAVPLSKEGNPPYCYFSGSYRAYQLIKHRANESGHYLELSRHTPIPYPNTYSRIFIEIIYLSPDSLRVRFNTTQEELFVPPIQLDLPQPDRNRESQYEVTLLNNVISVFRRKPHTLIWAADLNTLVLSEQFNQLFTTVGSNIVFGLGEHKDQYQKIVKDRKKILFFNRDEPPRENKALYGHHPFYMSYEQNGSTVNAHSALLLNVHPIELIFMNKPGMLWRTLGGSFDFFINLGPTPMQAIQQHVQMVGKPPLVPYWSLGFHLCRYGYNSIAKAREVTDRTIHAEIPYDTMWLDIDFMKDRTMFKLNDADFPNFKQWIDELHAKNMKFIPIIDPGLDDSYPESEYPYYMEAERQGLFIKHETGETLKAKVWSKAFNGWIDFTHPNATRFWTETFKKWNQETGFDGAWIDMNEPAQEYDGSNVGCPWNSRFEHPQYVPAELGLLAQKTSCMTAKHYAGYHYEYHNVYNLFEVQSTRAALVEMKKRPFIISRATVTGFGRYGSHWTGDVFSTWEDLQASIANLLEFNLFGIPVVGADICGFIWDTNEELCARWHAVGSFYTFVRNHNTIGTKDQDPVAMGRVVEEAARSTLKIRYSLLPLLYTELFLASQDGRPVARALSFVHPNDPNTFEIKNQFYWADKLMIVPVLEPNVRWLKAYFPAGQYWSYPELQLKSNTPNGEYQNLELPWEKIGVFVRGGSILATQQPGQTTHETRQTNFRLLVVLNEKKRAEGALYWDAGDDVDVEMTKNYTYIEWTVKDNILTSKPTMTAHPTPIIEQIDILGVGINANSIVLNGKIVESEKWHKAENRLSIRIELNPTDQFKLQWNF